MFLSPEIILKGYDKGIFPMSDSINDPFVYWVDPEERGIIKLESFRVPKSLKKLLKRKKFDIRVNMNFEKTISYCAQNIYRESSWINSQIKENYIKLFKIGKAKSIECYENKELVGGLYGLVIGKIFCGESMFSLKTNSSKITMVYLAAYLKEGGFKYIDTQFYTNHLEQFGTEKIKKEKYLEILSKYGRKALKFPNKINSNVLDYFE